MFILDNHREILNKRKQGRARKEKSSFKACFELLLMLLNSALS